MKLESIGERLRRIRKIENDMSQEDLAKVLGVEPAAVSKYETNRVPIPQETIKRISNTFNISTDYLLGTSQIRNATVNEAIKDNPDLIDFWNTMQDREDLQLMFKKTKELTPDAVRKIIEVIKLIEDNEDKEYDRKHSD